MKNPKNNGKFLFFALGLIFLMCLNNIDIKNIEPIHKEQNFYPNASATPTFISPFEANDTIFSPENMDGDKDNIEFSFEPSENCLYNLTIEEDGIMNEYTCGATTIAGNGTHIFRIYMDYIRNDWYQAANMYFTISDNFGLTWTEPIITNLSLSAIYSSYTPFSSHSKLRLICNTSDNSLILMFDDYYNSVPKYHTLKFYKSYNGIDWFYLSQIDNLQSTSSNKVHGDFCLSNNQSHIYLFYTTGYGDTLYFLKSIDGGALWNTKLIQIRGTGTFYPTIAVSPTSNTISILWWEQASTTYYTSSSDDEGNSWETPSKLDISHGIGSVSITYDYLQKIDMNYDIAGNLHAYLVYNYTNIYNMISTDDGANWENLTVFRNFGISKVFELAYYLAPDNQDVLLYRGEMSGNTVYGTSYFLRPKIVFSIHEGNALSSTSNPIIWDGKDMTNNFVRNGNYLAKIQLYSGSGEINNQLQQVGFKIDNQLTAPEIIISNENFSPETSPGVKDSTLLTFTPKEDLFYDVYYEREEYLYQTETRISNHESSDFYGDVASDEDLKLYCVYTSFQDIDRNIFIKTSSDFGNTWSLAKGIIMGTVSDDSPTIAIYQENIIIVFMRYHECLDSNLGYIWDLYGIISPDLGNTWGTPFNITMGEFDDPNALTNYYCPDIIASENGTIFLSYYRYTGTPTYIAQYELRKSVDIGGTFSNPLNLTEKTNRWHIGSPSALSFDENSQKLVIVCADQVGYNYNEENKLNVLISSDWGASVINTYNISQYNQWQYESRGLVLLNLGSGHFRIGSYSEYFPSESGWILYWDSMDYGQSWGWNSYTFNLELSGQPTTYHNYMRSGQNWRGDHFIICGQKTGNPENLDIYLRPIVRTTQHLSGLAFINTETTLSWNGYSFWNNIYQSEYNINISFNDAAGNNYETSKHCTLDMNVPEISLTTEIASSTTPKSAQSIAVFPSGGYSNDFNVTLYYNFISATADYSNITALYNGTHFVATIPANESARDCYFFFSALDPAGNSYNTSINSYYEPSIGYTIVDYSEVVTKSAWDPLNLEIEITVGEQYIDKLFISYELDGSHTEDFIELSPTYFMLPNIEHDSYPNSITYNLKVKYINGNETTLTQFTLYAPIIIVSMNELSANSTYDLFALDMTVALGEKYVDNVCVRYSINSTLSEINMTKIASNLYSLEPISFDFYLPSITYQVMAHYLNGTLKSITNITLFAPEFNIPQESCQLLYSSENSERKLDSQLTFTVDNIESKYVSKLYCDYRFNGDSSYKSEDMVLINGSSYFTTIDSTPQNSKLEYKIVLIDIKNQTHVIKDIKGEDAIIQEYIPLFPEADLEFQNQVYIVLISATIGTAISIVFIQNKRKGTKQMQERFLTTLHSIEDKSSASNTNSELKNKEKQIKEDKVDQEIDRRNTNSPTIQTLESLERSKFMYFFSTTATIIALGFGIYFGFVQINGTFAMIFTVLGIGLASLALVERLLFEISRGVYSEKNPNLKPLIVNIFLIATMIVAFIYTGSLVEWFNYYVVKDTFNFGNYKIPRLWLSLFSVFLTSVVILAITTYRDVSNAKKKFEISKLTGENWKNIFQQKEEASFKMCTDVALRAMVFLFTVSLTVFSTTNIGRYTDLLLLIFVPILLVNIVALVIYKLTSAQKPTVKEALEKWIIEKTKICPKCEKENLFDNLYCSYCRESFVLSEDKVVEKTFECPTCKKRSPQESEFCRFCGSIKEES